MAQMSYDLRRLRLKGILWRIPDSYRYQLTTYGRQVARLLSQLHTRIFRPTFAALDPEQPLPSPFRAALVQRNRLLDDLLDQAAIALPSF
jgi:hypothetical protein